MILLSSASYTLYKLQPNEVSFAQYCEEIITCYNQGLEEDNRFTEKENREEAPFKDVDNYKVYFSESKTQPVWQYPLMELVAEFPTLQNLKHSFVLFLECQNNIFAITGGKGYLVLSEYKDYNFGIELLSKILKPDESIIKETNDRYLSGNRASGQQQFLGPVTLNSESSISNFFKGIDVFLKREKIEELFGIKIEEGKKDYKFVARDSIRLGKSLSISEIDIFIKHICELLNKDTISNINNFYELNNRDPKIKELNDLLIREFIENANDLENESENLSLLEPQVECDEFKLLRNSTGNVLSSHQGDLDIKDIYRLYKEKFENNIQQKSDKNVLDDFIKQIFVVGVVEDETPVEISLLNLLDYKVVYNHKTYWLMNGKWIYLNNEFIAMLNTEFTRKVTSKYNQSKEIEELKVWEDNLNEGDYNFSHNEIENVIVLDKIFVDNIELCDLLLIKGSESYFVHVKDGLDRDARVLSEQIMASMTALENAQQFGDFNFFIRYYDSISNKIKNEVEQAEEPSLSRAARKFIEIFPSKENFLAWVNNAEINHNFVFAYRPAAQDINHPETIRSTPAKISMVNLIEFVKRFDFELHIVEIRKE
ncbi:MAG: DUF6119 family protein [Bacillota bacterium]